MDIKISRREMNGAIMVRPDEIHVTSTIYVDFGAEAQLSVNNYLNRPLWVKCSHMRKRGR